jgi:hypothetical protein
MDWVGASASIYCVLRFVLFLFSNQCLTAYFRYTAVGILTILRAVLCDDEPKSLSPTNGLCNTSGVGLLHLGLYYLIATSVNLVATTLICVRLVRMKHLVNKLSAASPIENSGDSPYSRVTAILLESALPFTVLGILSSVVAFVDTNGANHARIFASRMWTIANTCLFFLLSSS